MPRSVSRPTCGPISSSGSAESKLEWTETKELLGGLLILEARDLNHAIELVSNHPGIKMGSWEIRPADDLTPMIQESERRRAVKK